MDTIKLYLCDITLLIAIALFNMTINETIHKPYLEIASQEF